jgi:hypothetical protein
MNPTMPLPEFPRHDLLKKLDCRFPMFAEHPRLDAATIKVLKDTKNPMDAIYEQVRKTLGELFMEPVPAHELDEQQKFALLWAAGLMKYEDGKFVSICKVAIASAPDGRYIIGRSPF